MAERQGLLEDFAQHLVFENRHLFYSAASALKSGSDLMFDHTASIRSID
jgi:hypothetical protein